MTAPTVDLDAIAEALEEIDAEPEPEEPTRIARRATLSEAKDHFDIGGDVAVSEHGHEKTFPVGPQTTVHNWRTTTWKDLRKQVAEWRHRYPNQRYYIVPTTREKALGPLPKPEPTPAPEATPQAPAGPDSMRVMNEHPSLADALNAALTKLYPGESKAAKERRKKITQAIADELPELTVYGVEVYGGRAPIGEPIILGNARIEVDGYGDAVTIHVDGGMPLWDRA